jgi:EAL domain-containing protein (putative c-di-GMP-specific phosphodiesterase class I)
LGVSKTEAISKATSIARKVSGAFNSQFRLGNLSQSATASIGGVTFSGDLDSVDEILRLADAAMYDVKKSGRNAFKIFEEEQELDLHGRVNFINDLHGLTTRNELELRFQPQLNRRGTICGAEALLRWNHPQLGLLTPDKFMHLAETNGHIGAINAWVLGQAFTTLNKWQSCEATMSLRLSVNIGLQQFMNAGLANEIKLLARNHGADTSKLTLELTEKLVSKNREGSTGLLKKLKATGVRLSLDDFGVDFSSLSLLAEMPLDEIKIDGKFVKSMHNRPQNKALVKSILAMAEALGLSTVAEHVETQAQEKLLMEFGCTNFQGFLYGGAMNQSDFEMAVAHNAVAGDDQGSIGIAA